MGRLGPFEENTIVVGDCLDIMAQMPDGCVDLVVTSPPYNCRMDYQQGDEVAWDEWYALLRCVIIECYRMLREGGVLALNIPGVIRWQRDHAYANTWQDYDPDYLTHRGSQRNVRGKGRIEPVGFYLFGLMLQAGYKMREPIIWVKGSDGQAICSDYRMGCDSDPYMRPAHEFILLGSKKRWYHNGGTGRRGAEAVPFIDYTKDVWHIPPRSGDHPAPFPEEIPLRLIRLFVHRANTQDLPGPIIFDPFCGWGTTALVADRLGWHWFGCDISRNYVEMALERLEKDRAGRQLELC